MKGKQNVLSEVNLVMICYNLRRIMSILGPKELKNKLKGLRTMISAILRPILDFVSLLVYIPNIQGPKLQFNNTSPN